jgi:hypothetical protein
VEDVKTPLRGKGRFWGHIPVILKEGRGDLACHPRIAYLTDFKGLILPSPYLTYFEIYDLFHPR